MSSEDISDRTGTEIETNVPVTRKASGRGGIVVVVAVMLALALLMAFNMN